ncbi:hypothetical protein AB5I41_04175 [Sphingomonas sp. MMS24-JH45]
MRAHKAPGHAIVNISLKPVGGIPGDASADQIDVMADLAERYSHDELRVTHADIVLPHVRQSDLHAVWQALTEAGLAEANLDLISDIIACPGLDYCGSLANARSIPVAQKIAQRFADPARQRDLGELKLERSAAASTPAATTMPATSASWASTGRGRRITSSSSAARARRT